MSRIARHILLVLLAFNVCYAQEVQTLRAGRGREARLPCGPDSFTLDGPLSYVLWLKNDKAYYRYPDPANEILRGSEDIIPDTLCETGQCRDDTWLVIKNMTPYDEGRYRCRIHYQASPSVDYTYDLIIVEPTGSPKLYSENKLITQGTVGPLPLGSDVTIVCEVEDDEPKTAVYWSHEGDSALMTPPCIRQGHMRRIDIQLRNLSRGDLGSNYECVAQNADVTAPQVARVSIKMYFAPMSVQIRINENNNFEVGHPRVVDCVVVGCVPPPAVSWYLGTKKLKPSVHKELHDGNYTVSSLTLVPSLTDHGKELICRVHNFYMTNKVFEDKVILNVGYTKRAAARALARALARARYPRSVDDSASPINCVEENHGMTTGVEPDRPTCHDTQIERVGVVIREMESVKCIVEAAPAPVQFSWTFPDGKIMYTAFTKVSGHRNWYSAILQWQPQDADIGIMKCRALNSLGEQENGCAFNISAGGPPELPNCKTHGGGTNYLKVICYKGWDGGRPQIIHLEIRDNAGTCVKKVSNNSGQFYLTNMGNQTNMTAVVYASNTRGNSQNKTINLRNLPAIPGGDKNRQFENEWMLYILGTAFVVMFAIVATLLTVAYKIMQSDQPKPPQVHHMAIPDGSYLREPDVVRDERLGPGRPLVGINQLPACQNVYSSAPLSNCRLLLDPPPLPRQERGSTSQHTYYV